MVVVAVCACVHGHCNEGLDHDGSCRCFNGYEGALCDKSKFVIVIVVVFIVVRYFLFRRSRVAQMTQQIFLGVNSSNQRSDKRPDSC